jgi:hypothetical protein
MRAITLTLLLSLGAQGAPIFADPGPDWARIQYQEAQATEDPVARRLLLEHLLSALPEDSLLWLRVKGQILVIQTFEGKS